MSYFSTRIPAQWSPLTDYDLSDGVILRPAGRIVLESEFVKAWHDSIYFISTSSAPEQHLDLLKEWILFQSFFFACAPDIINDFELGRFGEHARKERLDEIPCDTKTNEYARDYDDIAKAVYFFHETDLQISYRDSFIAYCGLAPDLRNLIALWLFPFHRGIENNSYRLIDPAYLDVATKVTILETIIGHPPNCPTKLQCPDCQKQLPHRGSTEAAWRKDFFEKLPMTSKAREQYAALIDEACNAIRHPTVHRGAFPTASFSPQEHELETYDHGRAIKEFRDNSHALLGLTTSVSSITRYLLLDKLFGFRFFPEEPTLKSWTNRPSPDGQ